MPSLNDFPWQETPEGVEMTCAWKMVPAITVMTVGKKYSITMEDDRVYEGVFRGYTYKKQKSDSCQVNVSLVMETELGKFTFPDLEVTGVRSVVT